MRGPLWGLVIVVRGIGVGLEVTVEMEIVVDMGCGEYVLYIGVVVGCYSYKLFLDPECGGML